jgi:hypothetical protein
MNTGVPQETRACSVSGIEVPPGFHDPLPDADDIMKQLAEKPLSEQPYEWLHYALEALEKGRDALRAGLRGRRDYYDVALQQIQNHLLVT